MRTFDVTQDGRSFSAHVDRVDEAGWNTLLERFADANIYQTWAYGAVSWGDRQLSHLTLYEGGAAVAVAQVRIVRIAVLGAGIAYVRWGPLCVARGTAWDARVWTAAARALVQEYAVRRGLLLRIVPPVFLQDQSAGDVLVSLRGLGFAEDARVRQYHTHRVDLRLGADALRRQLSSRWRRQLGIAERNQLDVAEGQSDELYQQFLDLYREMMTRKQFDTSVDVDEFGSIQRRLPAAQKMMTFVCRRGGQPVAGLVVATVGTTAIYLLAATGDEGLDARGSYLLQWHAMQRLQQMGLDWYDLGGVNPDVNPGVFTFKSGMGGQDVVQAGRYQLATNRRSLWSVAAGETLQGLARRARDARKAPATTIPEPREQ